MSNVLPKETLQVEWKRFKNRLILVGALVFLGTAVFSGLALLPAHVALRVEETDSERQKFEEQTAVPGTKLRSQNELNDMMRAQTFLDTIGPIVSATSSPSEIISFALALRPSGVRVDHITFVSFARGTLTIEGISPGRENINQYREKLANSGRFKNVSVPVGSLVGAVGGRFTITLSEMI